MKILFLGTSAGWPLPRLGCDCAICQSPDSRDKRLRPSVLINETILVDAGPDIYHQLSNFKVDTRKIKVLVLTHAHPDHLLGFYDLTHIYNRQEKELKLVATQETINGLRQVHRLPLTPFRQEVVRPNEVIELEKIKMVLFPVEHGQFPCCGVKMKGEKLFVYLPDFRRLPKSEYKKCRDVHLLVLDGSSLGKRGQTRIHQSIEEGIELAKRLRPKKCFFTHIGHITGTYKELERFVQAQGGQNFHIAYDGLEVEI